MATQFPEELDSFLNPQPTDSVAAVSHAEQHSNANDAIEALEAKVGKDNSTDTESLDYKIRQIDPNNFDPAGAAATAQSNAEDYADGLASNYDPAGSAAAAQTAAEGFTTQAIANLIDSAPATLDTLNELAAALQDNPDIISDLQDIAAGKQDALTAGSNIDITGVTISVTGLDSTNISDFNTAALSATSTAYDPAGAAAQALLDAQGYADTAEADAISAAALDATSKANAAQAAAELYADGLATNYDPAGSASTAETNANTYTDTALNDYTPTVSLDTTVGGYGYLKSADLSGYATESYVGTAIGNIIDGAPALLDTLNELAAAIGDDENFVTTINNALATKITASSLDTLTNKTISIQSGLTSVVGYDDITGFYGQSDIPVIQGGLDKGGRINISSEGVITQSAPGTGYTSGLAIIGGGTRVAIGTSNNTLIGNLSDFNAALLDADFATTVDITNAIQDANDYADGLAVNYDPAGAAATAQSNAEDYTDTAIASLGDDIEAGYIPVTEKATAGGVASLNLSGKVPDTQLDIDSTIQNVASSMITGGTHTNISTSFDNVTKKLSFSTTPLTQDQIQDFVAPLFTHAQHTNITATYDDDNNRIVLQGSSSSGGGASVTISPTAPTSPTLGNIWLDSDNGSTFIWDGVYWVEIGGASTADAIAAVASTAPTNPTLGRIWLNASTAKTYIYDGSYWVEI